MHSPPVLKDWGSLQKALEFSAKEAAANPQGHSTTPPDNSTPTSSVDHYPPTTANTIPPTTTHVTTITCFPTTTKPQETTTTKPQETTTTVFRSGTTTPSELAFTGARTNENVFGASAVIVLGALLARLGNSERRRFKKRIKKIDKRDIDRFYGIDTASLA